MAKNTAFGVGGIPAPPPKRDAGIILTQKLTMTAGQSRRFDNPIRSVVSIIVSVFTGVADIWSGEYSGVGSAIPDIRVVPGEAQQYWFPPGNYTFVVAQSGTDTLNVSFVTICVDLDK